MSHARNLRRAQQRAEQALRRTNSFDVTAETLPSIVAKMKAGQPYWLTMYARDGRVSDPVVRTAEDWAVFLQIIRQAGPQRADAEPQNTSTTFAPHGTDHQHP